MNRENGENFDNIWGELAQHTERTELKPEQKSDLMMAAQLNELVRDYDSAATLYKHAGEIKLADENRALGTATATEKASQKINPHLEKLVKKIARWLMVRQQWNTPEQQKAFKDIRHVEYDDKSRARVNKHPTLGRGKYDNTRIDLDSTFPLTFEDPDLHALLDETRNRELLDKMISEQLGVPEVSVKKLSDHPYAHQHGGLKLAEYGNNI